MMPSSPASSRRAQTTEVGRYAVYGDIAHGGMATVHLGRLRGAAGFERTVAIKRLHPAYAKDPEFVAMFTDEARLASRIQHPNVVSTLDVVQRDDELFLVLEYIHGETLAQLLRRAENVPPAIASAIMCGTLHGLHAAHEATDERGNPLGLVHRDISPQNVLVGVDGVPRVLDFGVAKAAGRVHTTQDGFVKGKLAYMPPEQLYGEKLDRRADIYAAAVVLWEMLVGERLFAKEGAQPALLKVVDPAKHALSVRVEGLPRELDDVVLSALTEEPEGRPNTALELAQAIEAALRPASAAEVAAWVRSAVADSLEARAALISNIENEALEEREVLSQQAAARLEPTELDIDPLELPPGVVDDDATVVTPPANAANWSETISEPPTVVTRRPRGGLWAGAAVLLLLGGAAALVAALPGDPAPAAANVASSPARATQTATAEATAPAPSPPTNPEPTAQPTPEPAASPTPSVTAPSPKPASPAPVKAPKAAPRKAPDCSKPYVIDSKGHKQYKRECF